MLLTKRFLLKASALIGTLVPPEESQHAGRALIQHLRIQEETRLRRRRAAAGVGVQSDGVPSQEEGTERGGWFNLPVSRQLQPAAAIH